MLSDDSGTTAVEYGLIAALVALAIVSAVGTVGLISAKPSIRLRRLSKLSHPE
jgi:hypothetical protein